MNLLRTLHGAVSVTNHALDGVAVVSDIMASHEPGIAAQKLRSIVGHFQQNLSEATNILNVLRDPTSEILPWIVLQVKSLIVETRKRVPLVHQVREWIRFRILLWMSLLLDHEHCGANAISERNLSCRSQSYHGYRTLRDGGYRGNLQCALGKYWYNEVRTSREHDSGRYVTFFKYLLAIYLLFLKGRLPISTGHR